MCVTPHWGWTRGRVRERICRDLESCPDSRASSPWCSGPDISGSRRRACLVWGSCSAPRGKGRAEHPMLVRSCRVPTEPALPWQGNLALPGRLHQDDPRGATSIPEQSQKGPASPAMCTTPAALPASSLCSSSSSSSGASLDGGHSQWPQPSALQPHLLRGRSPPPQAGPRAWLTSMRPHVPGP